MNNLDNLTLGDVKSLKTILGSGVQSEQPTLNDQIGNKVIIRTYSAGVHFGTLTKKSGNEVYLKNSRRLWRFWAAKSISLSGVAVYGINQEKSKICPVLEKELWLEAIEIIPLTEVAINSIEGAIDVEAE